MTLRQIQRAIEAEGDFSAPSGVAAEMIALTAGRNAPVQLVAPLLEKDQRLVARLLAVLNSGCYRFTDPVSTVDQAFQLLGYRKVHSLAVGVSLLERFPQEDTGRFDYRDFWARALRTATAACEIVACLKASLPADAFSIGLFQNVGNLFLVRHCPLPYGQALGLAVAERVHIAQAEREILGIDHAQVGAMLCKHWRLSSTLVESVRNHHFADLDELLNPDLEKTAQIANLSGLFETVLHHTDADQQKELLFERARTFLHLGRARVEGLCESIPDRLEKVSQALSLPVSTGPDSGSERDDRQRQCARCGAPASGWCCTRCGAPVEGGPGRGTRSLKVLIAEDSVATRQALSSLVRKMGYDPVEALNGTEAVAAAQRDPPGMILMDIGMPDMDGLEALKRIRAEKATAGIPVVVLTSLADRENVLESMQSGANDYVVKPFTARLIQERVEKYMPSRRIWTSSQGVNQITNPAGWEG